MWTQAPDDARTGLSTSTGVRVRPFGSPELYGTGRPGGAKNAPLGGGASRSRDLARAGRRLPTLAQATIRRHTAAANSNHNEERTSPTTLSSNRCRRAPSFRSVAGYSRSRSRPTARISWFEPGHLPADDASHVPEQGHEPEVHVELLVTMK